jgi:hypothetical protein
MRAFVDISIFSTPTKALGNATGVIDLPCFPVLGQPIRWPKTSRMMPSVVEQVLRSDLVTNVDHDVRVRNAEIAISTDGLVHQCEDDARKTSECLESAYGLHFSEY